MKPVLETKDRSYTGSCHCGAVTIAMTGPFYPFVICHCRDCLRTAGFSWSAAKLDKDNLTFTSGADNVDWYASSDFAKRGFCKTCHAQMFFCLNDSEVMSVSVGMFDNYDAMQAAGHIFRGDLPDCMHNNGALPDIDSDFYSEQS